MNDDLKSLVGVLTAPGMKDLDREIYEYIAPIDRDEFDLRRSWLNRAMKFDAKTKKDKGRKGAVIGKLFEKLVVSLLKGSLALKYKENLRSTTSEIDFLLSVTPVGVTMVPMLAARTHVLGEAKCYSSGPKHEWITELVGLMTFHSTKLSFLFLGCKSQKLQREFRTAVAYAAIAGSFVVPFGSKQVEEIAAGANFLELLSAQFVAASSHTSDLEV